jgi:hypothetical protein
VVIREAHVSKLSEFPLGVVSISPIALDADTEHPGGFVSKRRVGLRVSRAGRLLRFL